MSSSKIEMEFSGKYSVGRYFSQLNKDVKQSGREFKDFGNSAKSVASGIAGAFGGKLNATLNTSLSLVNEMAKGGIWGVMSIAANTAISLIAEKWHAAKEAAKKYAEICRENIVGAMRSIVDGFSGVSKSIDDTTANARELLRVVNGEVATKAELKVHEINVKALQSITNDMTTATRNAIMATAAFEQAQVKAAAAVEEAVNNVRFAEDAELAARQKREAAEAALVQAQGRRAAYEEQAAAYGTGWLARYRELQEKANLTTEQLTENGLSYAQALKFRKASALALSKFEDEHKEAIASLNNVTKLESDARVNLEAAKREEVSATRNVTLASQREQVARASAADMVEQGRIKRVEADAALEQEKIALKAEVARKEQEAVIANEISRIKSICLANDVEYAEYVELYTMAVKDGYEQQTINTLLQKKLNAELKKRGEQLAEGNAGAGKGGSSTANLVKAIKEGVGSTTVNTSVNTGEVGGGVDKSNQVITLGSLQREVRDEQRQARDKADAIAQSSQVMQEYLKGRLSPEVAEKFEQKMKANGWTIQDFDKCVVKALKAQLLTHTQVLDQQRAILAMKEKLEKMGLK